MPIRVVRLALLSTVLSLAGVQSQAAPKFDAPRVIRPPLICLDSARSCPPRPIRDLS